jgi:hypothetical protein
MHGGKSPGAPKGKANGNHRNGIWTEEWRNLKRSAGAVSRFAKQVDDGC